MAQGVSFSYLIPTDGSISAPVSPFSIRGIGFGFNRHVGIETGASLYLMSGLPIRNLPFETEKPAIGPHAAILLPLQLTVGTGMGRFGIWLKGGGFGLAHIKPTLNYGPIDRGIAAFENWAVANADFDFENNLGAGWIAGVDLDYAYSEDVTITFGVQYLKGRSDFPIEGSYSGTGNGVLLTRDVQYEDSFIGLEGWEISIGASF